MGAVILSIHQDFVQRCHFKLRPPFQQMTIEHIVYHKSAYLSMVFFTFLKKFGIVFVLIRKVYYSLALLHCIIYSLPCTALFVLNIADNQIGSINHFTVSNLDSRFGMCYRSNVGYLYVGVVVVKVIFVIKILCRRIRQHQHKALLSSL